MPALTVPPAIASSGPAPAGDRRLAELAVVNGAVAGHGPEVLVRTDVPQPDGSVRLYANWTAGGGPLADRIDCAALACGLDAWSWIEVLQRHGRTVRRGRIEVRAYPLRQVFADVERGYRGDERLRAGFARLLADDAAREGRAGWPAPGVPAWVGVGPVLWDRYQGGDPVVGRRWLAR